MIADVLAANQTDLMVEVRYRSDALYQTNRNKDIYPNPEPRSYILANDGFDPLAYVLQKAKSLNLKVHAWVVVFNATPLNHDLIAANYIYRNHNDWITFNNSGTKMNSSEQFGYFIDPGIPEVQDYVINVLSDLVSGYPELDGLHLDYIRYPNTTWGYHPTSVGRYEEHRIVHGFTSWNDWRKQQITGFVDRMYRQAKAINPNLIVSAAVFANYRDAVDSYAQAWKDWLDMGIIDFVYPMLYHVDWNEFNYHLDVIGKMGHKNRSVIGIRAWDANGGSLRPGNTRAFSGYTLPDVINRVERIREHDFAGVALFSYDGLIKGDVLAMLAKESYTDEIVANEDSLQGQFAFDMSSYSPLVPFAADFKLNLTGRQYVVSLLIPAEGTWGWEILDLEDNLLYSRNRYYPKGPVEDFWNGMTNQGYISPGRYKCHIYSQGLSYQYIIPVEFAGFGVR
jgi:uncharacterized lipoprotein YddW (UPF0748 family)